MPDVSANGNYAQYLAQALTPPMMGAGSAQFGPQNMLGGFMSGYGQQSGQPFGSHDLGQQGLFGNPLGGVAGNSAFGGQGFNAGVAGVGHSLGGQVGQQGLLGQQGGGQQIAAVLGQLAQHTASQGVAGQQIGTAVNQLANQIASQGAANQQIGIILSQLAHQVAWQGQTGQQVGAVLGQLAQQAQWQGGLGQIGHLLGGIGGQQGYGQLGFGQQGLNPQTAWALSQLANQLNAPNQLNAQGRYGNAGTIFGSGAWGQQGYGMFGPQAQAWGLNRPGLW